MGWNQVEWLREHPITDGHPERFTYFYFVHSFYPAPDRPLAGPGRDNLRAHLPERARAGERRGDAVPPGEERRSRPRALREFRGVGARGVSFEVIPAIDIRGGRCVRLTYGDYDQETVYDDDPAAMAREWESQGATRLHVVDLDGAREGHPVNRAEVAAICEAVAVPVEVSGGLRTIEDIEAAAGLGAMRIQLGSAAVRNPELVNLAVERFPGMVVVAIDTRAGEALTEGWIEGSGANALTLAKEMVERGAPRIMVTDVGRDGALEGPNVALATEFAAALPVPVVAAGGVTTADDLRALAETGCEGAIVGKALYERRFTLAEALEAVAAC